MICISNQAPYRYKRREGCKALILVAKAAHYGGLRNVRSTVLCSQLPVDKWHAYLGEPTLADTILDRLVHHSHRIELKVPGESMRKNRAPAAHELLPPAGAD